MMRIFRRSPNRNFPFKTTFRSLEYRAGRLANSFRIEKSIIELFDFQKLWSARIGWIAARSIKLCKQFHTFLLAYLSSSFRHFFFHFSLSHPLCKLSAWLSSVKKSLFDRRSCRIYLPKSFSLPLRITNSIPVLVDLNSVPMPRNPKDNRILNWIK